MGCFRCRKTTTTNIYDILYGANEDPSDNIHPIRAGGFSDKIIWVFRQFSPFTRPPPPTNKRVLENRINPSMAGTSTLVRDAPVHVQEGKVAGAWHLIDGEKNV